MNEKFNPFPVSMYCIEMSLNISRVCKPMPGALPIQQKITRAAPDATLLLLSDSKIPSNAHTSFCQERTDTALRSAAYGYTLSTKSIASK
jgi:hypothetical protein